MSFHRIIYPVLIWVESGWGTEGLSFLFMLLACGFVVLVSSVDYFKLSQITPSNRVKGKFETCEKS